MDDKLGILKKEIAQGNEDAYGRLFHQTYNSLLRFAVSLTKDQHTSEEIISDVLLHIWVKRSKLLEIDNLNTYLFIAVKNNCLRHLSRIKKVTAIEDCDPIATFATPEMKLLSDETYVIIQKAIQNLPARCKMCFQLVKEEGLSYKETGAILGISSKTVDAQIVTALKRIAEKLI